MNLPNKLVLFRLILVPFIFLTLFIDLAHAKYIGLALLILAVLTDKIDGYLARKNDMVTDFGSFFDPLVDKLLSSGSFIIFGYIGLIPIWLVLAMVLRDFTMQGIRSRASAQGVMLKCRWESKLKASLQVLTVIAGFFLIAVQYYTQGCCSTLHALIKSWTPTIMFWLMLLTVIFAYLAFIYFFRAKENRNALLKGA